jgi:hypothetical protein
LRHALDKLLKKNKNKYNLAIRNNGLCNYNLNLVPMSMAVFFFFFSASSWQGYMQSL